MESYAAVRRFVFVEGKSRREAARVFGLSRDMIDKMCRFSVPPGYRRQHEPEKPKLGRLIPVIDAILEADRTAPPKQRRAPKWGGLFFGTLLAIAVTLGPDYAEPRSAFRNARLRFRCHSRAIASPRASYRSA